MDIIVTTVGGIEGSDPEVRVASRTGTAVFVTHAVSMDPGDGNQLMSDD